MQFRCLTAYSGHGIRDHSGNLYFGATDTDPDLLRSTSVSASFVNDMMSESKSKNQIMFLDCCHAGAFARGLADTQGRVVITSSSSLQYSYEKSYEDGEAVSGVFTSALVSGLETGDADIDSDGRVTCFDLFNYITYMVEEKQPNQTPKMWAFDLSGDIVIAESSRKQFRTKINS